MNAARLSRIGHKWLALVVGLQLVLWTISGFYMVVVDLDFIHGDTLVRNLAPPVDVSQALIPLNSLRAGRPDIQSIKLRALPDNNSPVFEILTAGRAELVDARSGFVLSPLSTERVASLARAYYAGKSSVGRVRLIATDADRPAELQDRPTPLWRVDFDDWLETSLYLDPDTGVLVTRRHRFWRWFDFLWSLHIMDYETRSDVNNWLLRTATVIGLATAGTGIWLTFFSFKFLQRRPAKRTKS
jgi:uncharacterized iron-regulated membrane protein